MEGWMDGWMGGERGDCLRGQQQMALALADPTSRAGIWRVYSTGGEGGP